MTTKCPFPFLHFAKEVTKKELGKPNISHDNYLREINGKPIEFHIAHSWLSFDESKNKMKDFYIYIPEWEKLVESSRLTLSEIGLLLYIYLVKQIDWVHIKKAQIIANDRAIAGNIWLIYYALQPIDTILSQASQEELSDSHWILRKKRELKILGSLPDHVQKWLTIKPGFIELIQRNIDSILHLNGFVSRKKFQVHQILRGVYITKFYKDWKYGVCPAVLDWSLEKVFDVMLPYYKTHREKYST